MKSAWIALALVASSLLTSPLAAQELSAQEVFDEPVLIEALVVNARTPGPAWWSVSKGEAKVWVLGLAGPVPSASKWDTGAFDKRVKAARRLIYADPKGKSKLSNDAIKADRPWLEELTPGERQRLEAVVATTGKPMAYYTNFRPNFAALLIKGRLKPSKDAPRENGADVLLKRAKSRGAKETLIKGQFREGFKRAFAKGDKDGLACLRSVIEPDPQKLTAAARSEAWMRGDVRVLVSRRMTYDPCTQSIKALSDIIETHETALADEVAATLNRGEGAVVLVNLTPLLRQGGVLDQLRQRGFTVRTPAVDD